MRGHFRGQGQSPCSRSALSTWARNRAISCRPSRPAASRGREIDPLAGKGLALAVQRQVVGKLAGQDRREQPGAGAAPGDRMERCRRLGDALAVPAGEFLPHRLDHLELSGDDFQRLGDTLAQFRQTG